MKRKLICKADLQKLKTIGWILVAQNIKPTSSKDNFSLKIICLT